MWRIWHFLFGWDYIVWRNTADNGVARIYPAYNKYPFYWRYKNTKVVDSVITADQVVWLTCYHSKYMKED